MLVLTVSGFTAAENVTTTVLDTATFVAPLAGTTDTTVGAVCTGVEELPVVNVLVNAVTGLPARSVNPPTVTVYAVLTASGAAKATLTTDPLATAVPATAVPPADTTIAFAPTLTALTGALNCTCTAAFTGTFVAPFGGVTAVTVNGPVCVPTPVANVLYVVVDSRVPFRSAMPFR